MITIISNFRGAYHFLSNFYPCSIILKDMVLNTGKMGNIKLPSSEHYFHLIKAREFGDYECVNKIISAPTPSKAKSLGRSAKIKNDYSLDKWNRDRIGFMREVLFEKFTQNLDLKQKLIDTAPHILVEGNTWNDSFWGYDLNKEYGKNWLGILLMELRNGL